MSTFSVTFILIAIALLAMAAAGWFAKGHTNSLCGRCGSDPDRKEKKPGMRCSPCDPAPPQGNGEQ